MRQVGDVKAQQRAVRWLDVRSLRSGATEPAFTAMLTTVAMALMIVVTSQAALARLDSFRLLSDAQSSGLLPLDLADRLADVSNWVQWTPFVGVGAVIVLGLWMLHSYTNLATRRWRTLGLALAWIGPISTGTILYIVANFGVKTFTDGLSKTWDDAVAAEQYWLPTGVAIVLIAVMYMQASFGNLDRSTSDPTKALAWLPPVNIWLPKRAVDEVWSAGVGSPPVVVDVWWMFGLLGGMSQLIKNPTFDKIEDLRTARIVTGVQLGGDALLLLFALSTLFIVWRLTLAQGRLIDALRDAKLAHLASHRSLGHR